MREAGGNTHPGLSARGMIVAVMAIFMALGAAWGAMRLFLETPAPPEEDKAAAIAGAANDGINRVPQGSAALVLLTPPDFVELAYIFYHAPPAPGIPEKLPLSSPDRQREVNVYGRRLIFALYEPGNPEDIPKIIASYNSSRGESRIEYAVAVSWRPDALKGAWLAVFADVYNREGKEMK